MSSEHMRTGSNKRPDCPRCARSSKGQGSSSRCAGDEGGDDVAGVAVERHACPVVAHGGARVGVGGLLDVAKRSPASSAAALATRRTTRAAAWPSRRRPSLPSRIGPSGRSPMARRPIWRCGSRAPPRPAATSIAPSSLRSSPVAWDSWSNRGRRTWTAGEWAIRPSCSA